METLWFTKKHADLIVQHALRDAPHEACGLIVGNYRQVVAVIPINNIADEPRYHYKMDPAELAKHLPEIHAAGQSIVGFYHSHPDGDPLFSETDRRKSNWPGCVHLIVGLRSDSPRLAAWKNESGRVFKVETYIGDEPPGPDDMKLSNAQKAAIIAAGLIVFALMIVLSLSLLPPAPPIP